MKKNSSKKILMYSGIALILIAAFVLANIYKDIPNTVNQTGFCNVPSDCEDQGLPHIMCVGNWICNKNACGWSCSVGVVDQNDTGVLSCSVDRDCPPGTCPDGSTYNQYSCVDNKCHYINYFADPCRFR